MLIDANLNLKSKYPPHTHTVQENPKPFNIMSWKILSTDKI